MLHQQTALVNIPFSEGPLLVENLLSLKELPIEPDFALL